MRNTHLAISLPTSITESNVVWGIAAPVAIVRAPQAYNKAQEEAITFSVAPGAPPLILPKMEVIDSGTTKGGRFYNEFKIRFQFRFRYPLLNVEEVQKWGRLWEYHMAGYEIWLRPHNDSGLQLEWQVVPAPNSDFDLGYVAEKYIGHTLEVTFISVEWQDNLVLRSSAVTFAPATH